MSPLHAAQLSQLLVSLSLSLVSLLPLSLSLVSLLPRLRAAQHRGFPQPAVSSGAAPWTPPSSNLFPWRAVYAE